MHHNNKSQLAYVIRQHVYKANDEQWTPREAWVGKYRENVQSPNYSSAGIAAEQLVKYILSSPLCFKKELSPKS